MATRVEIKGDRISFLRIMVGFLPLAFGYFLSVLFQSLDPLIADDLTTDLAIGKGTLGMLTAAFPLAFAVCLLPSGIAIDRFGPRAVQAVMMAVAALGALICGLSTGSFGLMMGRTLLGAGAASALLAAMKAVVTWFPRERLGLATGCLIAVAGVGALAMADPAAVFVRAHGWRALFILLAALSTFCAILALLLVPTPATVTGDVPDHDHGLPFVLRDPVFRRLAPLAAIVVGTVWAIQGQWVAGWLGVNGVRLTSIITYISFIAVGQAAGALVWGWLADWAVRKGLSAARVFVGAVALSGCIQLAAVGGIALPNSIVWGVLVAAAAATLPFVVLLTHFPQAYAARACASIGVLQYVATLFIQSAVGGVVAIWPHAASGQTSATAYAMAFMVPIALQLAALAWILFPRSETRDGAQSVEEIAVAFEAARSAAQVQGLSEPPPIPGGLPANVAASPAGTAVQPTEAAGETVPAASASAETVEALTDNTPAEPASPTSGPPDAAATPADTAVEPAEIAVDPVGAALAPTETVSEAAVPVSAPEAEAEAARTDSPAAPSGLAGEPVGTAGAAAETVTALTGAALRSVLDGPLTVGPAGAIDTISRASADPSDGVAPDHDAETAQPQAQGLSLPRVAPSHVQALNAVYRRRPALAATIGGRRTTIVAAWPPSDRRPEVSHRVALRLDGEAGELWLPQSMLDVLVNSVDPALSLDRLGPDRAAIVLEFALDSALTAVEMMLGCKLAIDSYSGQVERLENDGQLPLFFTLVIEGLLTTGCELRIPPDYAFRLAEGLDRHAGIDRSVLDLPIPVCLRVAAANLTAGEIERLSPDDVVLVDASCEPGDDVIAVIGERLVASVALGPEGPRLATHPIPGATSSWAWSMPTDATAGAWEGEAETDNRPLHVLFEIGRFELPASQVKQLAPNFLLPLEPLHDQTVDIVVDGQRIGRGTLMRIGNRTGVRVIAVRERPRPAPGLKDTPAGEQ
ncbi:MFS transporter [Bradyrhizobium roseum]|uniref:MFS transporter n=1 Tax=Bradyrhizobium roseum TaxID=3056648 RepID=UPI0026223C87|nr:MFS transporter [Bradyrhizobium roseus]WKA30053.1 MFS transporter [Bradyrhizobium roseus]